MSLFIQTVIILKQTLGIKDHNILKFLRWVTKSSNYSSRNILRDTCTCISTSACYLSVCKLLTFSNLELYNYTNIPNKQENELHEWDSLIILTSTDFRHWILVQSVYMLSDQVPKKCYCTCICNTLTLFLFSLSEAAGQLCIVIYFNKIC